MAAAIIWKSGSRPVKSREFISRAVQVLGFLAVFWIVPVAVFWGIRAADDAASDRLSAASGALTIDSSFRDGLHPLVLPPPDAQGIGLRLENRSGETLRLALCRLYAPHRILRDGQTVSQNIDPAAPHYNPAMRAKELNLASGVSPVDIRIEGEGPGNVPAFLARKAAMQRHRRLAGEFNAFLSLVVLALGLLMPLVSGINRRWRALEAAVLAVFVFCLLKIALLDISAAGAGLIPFPPQQFAFWDAMTTFGFSFSMFLIYALFFDVRPRRPFYAVLGGYALLMFIDYAVEIQTGGAVILRPAVLLLRVALFMWILGYAVLNRKPFARSILLIHAVSDGIVVYYVYLQHHPEAIGRLSFYVDLAFLAFSVQFLFALAVFLGQTLIQSRDYRRLLMLRGLEHDLKIPLSVIKLNHQMMQRYCLRDDDSNGHRFAGAIDRALADLDGMLQNLRYHLEIRPAAPRGRTALAPLFLALQEDFRAVCAARGASFAVEIPGGDMEAAIDPDILKRILHNLLDNAFKHGGAGLQVRLAADARWGKIRMEIRDNGAGMSGAERRRSVRLFHKGDPARSTTGLGLGLHVVRTLIRQNRGTLAIQSRKGEGTTVTVTLPHVSGKRECSQTPTGLPRV